MLPTFVIGLREGLEAALIVGIIAAFLRQRGRLDLLRLVWLGVGVAAALCLAVGVALKIVSAELPERAQETLETIVGLIAVAMVTYMVVWMRRNSRGLKKQLEGAADAALLSGSGAALVAMAFLAVLREGFETAVFLVAAFNQTSSPAASGAGAVLGVAVAGGLGYGIYRGGVRINLSKFFRATGLVLVLVAAGLVVKAAHTAHEAGWLDIGQSRTFDLSWLVRPGSVQASLLTGMLGWQPRPVTVEVVVWLLYLVPIGLYVAWPPGRRTPLRTLTLAGATTALACGLAALVLLTAAPDGPAAPGPQRFDTTGTASGPLAGAAGQPGAARGWVLSRSGGRLTVETVFGSERRTWTAELAGAAVHAGRPAQQATAQQVVANPAGLPATLTPAEVADANGGRLPLGAGTSGSLPVTYASAVTISVWLDVQTGRILDVARVQATTATLRLALGSALLAGPVRSQTTTATSTSRSAAATAAAASARDGDRRNVMRAVAGVLAVLTAVGAVVAAVFGLSWLGAPRRATRSAVTAQGPVPDPATAAARS